MSNEDKVHFTLLMIVSVIVMMVNVQTLSTANRRGLSSIDSAFSGYLSSTAQKWSDASINQTVQEELEIVQELPQ
ncbi:MAG: hypothetical protein RRY12_02705 [Cloacibacillus sp.]